MRRYTVRINDTDHVLDVEELARDTFTVHLDDGRLVDVLLTDHQDLAQAVIAPQLEIGHVRQRRADDGLGRATGCGLGPTGRSIDGAPARDRARRRAERHLADARRHPQHRRRRSARR